MNRGSGSFALLAPYCLGYYVSYLLRSVNAVIAPELSAELGLTASDLGFLTSTYFLSFAAAQLPVGLALDRLGPRRVVALLLAVAAAGVLLFASARSFAGLALGRALVGVGVSACLMGALKAAADSFPVARQASLTGVIMAAGATGALTASVPLEAALPHLGWRGCLLVVAGLCALAALSVAVGGRGSAKAAAAQPVRAQGSWQGELRALLQALRARAFWRYAPQALLFTGGFMAVQGLWVVPWAMTVEGRSRAGAAALLLALSAGMLTGQLAIGVGAGRLLRAGLGRRGLMTAGLALALVIQALIIAGLLRGPLPWAAFGFTSAVSAQIYGVASAQFSAQLSGRVSTALNMLAFAGAFFLQWGIGAALDLVTLRLAPARAFTFILAVLWVCQAAAVAWAAFPRSGDRAVSASSGRGSPASPARPAAE